MACLYSSFPTIVSMRGIFAYTMTYLHCGLQHKNELVMTGTFENNVREMNSEFASAIYIFVKFSRNKASGGFKIIFKR